MSTWISIQCLSLFDTIYRLIRNTNKISSHSSSAITISFMLGQWYYDHEDIAHWACLCELRSWMSVLVICCTSPRNRLETPSSLRNLNPQKESHNKSGNFFIFNTKDEIAWFVTAWKRLLVAQPKSAKIVTENPRNMLLLAIHSLILTLIVLG